MPASLHPDVSDEPETEIRFREATEAYEVLSNSERRALYDRYGHAGLRSGGFTPTHFDVGGLSDLFAAFFGDDVFGGGARGGGSAARPRSRGRDRARRSGCDGVKVQFRSRSAVTLRDVRRRRRRTGHAARRARAAEGSGRLHQVSRSIFGEFVRAQTCPDCHGRGRSSSTRASNVTAPAACRAATLDVDVPAGIHDGQRIRVSGEGHDGALGGRAGDVYVLVHVNPDPRFVREGNDIYSQVDLTIVEAALGVTTTIETLEGTSSSSFRPASQPGEVRVLRGKGMPSAGLRPRRPPRARERLRAAACERRAAPPAGGVRRGERRAPTGTTRASSTS